MTTIAPSQMNSIDPVCLVHGKRKSEHVCLYCCLCFKSLTPEECHVLPGGNREDVCNECAEKENAARPLSIDPCQMTRELRLKTALARLLPDEIEITDLNNFRWKCGELAGSLTQDTEWDYIVRKCYEVTDQKVGCFYPDHWLRFGEGLLIQLDIDWDASC